MSKVFPSAINLHKKSRILEIQFNDGKNFNFSCEFLRTHSKSAEVTTSDKPVFGKVNVNIDKIEPQGEYGIRLYFDDGYDTGIFSWDSLYSLGIDYSALWNKYLMQLTQYNLQRGESDKKLLGKITLLYFMDKLIKITKAQEEVIELTENIKTVDDLLTSLKKRGLIWEREFEEDRMLFTVNKEFAELFTVLEDGDEIAFVPKSI
jgi:DUF971 family protein/molybdopterin converting factor small subunit